jgi:hypothetical protein
VVAARPACSRSGLMAFFAAHGARRRVSFNASRSGVARLPTIALPSRPPARVFLISPADRTGCTSPSAGRRVPCLALPLAGGRPGSGLPQRVMVHRASVRCVAPSNGAEKTSSQILWNAAAYGDSPVAWRHGYRSGCYEFCPMIRRRDLVIPALGNDLTPPTPNLVAFSVAPARRMASLSRKPTAGVDAGATGSPGWWLCGGTEKETEDSPAATVVSKETGSRRRAVVGTNLP